MLKQRGYKCAVDFEPHEYSTRNVELSIDRGYPVLLAGSSEAIEIPLIGITFGIGGHVWLCDGYRVRERSVEVFDWLERKVIYRKKETLRLLHCNWGWGVSSNGYYYAGVFDSKNRVIKDSVLNGSREGYYQYDIEQIADVYH